MVRLVDLAHIFWRTLLLESHVEGNTMAIPFCLSNHSVTVKKYSFRPISIPQAMYSYTCSPA